MDIDMVIENLTDIEERRLWDPHEFETLASYTGLLPPPLMIVVWMRAPEQSWLTNREKLYAETRLIVWLQLRFNRIQEDPKPVNIRRVWSLAQFNRGSFPLLRIAQPSQHRVGLKAFVPQRLWDLLLRDDWDNLYGRGLQLSQSNIVVAHHGRRPSSLDSVDLAAE
jgi:hypothetical protein